MIMVKADGSMHFKLSIPDKLRKRKEGGRRAGRERRHMGWEEARGGCLYPLFPC